MVSRVRLRRSGLVVFFTKLVSTAVGLIFALLVARELSPSDYGLWGFLAAFASYFMLPSRLYSYWITRDEARGLSAAKTGVAASMTLAAPACAFFLLCYVFLRLFRQFFNSDLKNFRNIRCL